MPRELSDTRSFFETVILPTMSTIMGEGKGGGATMTLSTMLVDTRAGARRHFADADELNMRRDLSDASSFFETVALPTKSASIVATMTLSTVLADTTPTCPASEWTRAPFLTRWFCQPGPRAWSRP